MSTAAINAPAEEWRLIADFPAYEVSNLGRVRRCVASHTSKKGKLLRGKKHTFGYRVMSLYRENKQFFRYLHILVAEAFLGPKPGPGWQVRHLDGDPSNNRLPNLQWGTPAENGSDKSAHGRVKGSKNPFSRLSEEDVLAIRGPYQPRHPEHGRRARAEEFGVNVSTIDRVLCHERWTHV